MEEKTINEQESFEIISRMIANTRSRLDVGSGNEFLLWGYISAFVAFSVYALYTEFYNPSVNLLWFAIPILGFLASFLLSKSQPKKTVVTYTDRIVSLCWRSVGIASAVSMLALACLDAWILMLPIALFLSAAGTAFTGIVIRCNWLIYPPIISFAVAVIMLASILVYHNLLLEWILIFSACFIFSMIIPGHIINRKAKRQNV